MMVFTGTNIFIDSLPESKHTFITFISFFVGGVVHYLLFYSSYTGFNYQDKHFKSPSLKYVIVWIFGMSFIVASLFSSNTPAILIIYKYLLIATISFYCLMIYVQLTSSPESSPNSIVSCVKRFILPFVNKMKRRVTKIYGYKLWNRLSCARRAFSSLTLCGAVIVLCFVCNLLNFQDPSVQRGVDIFYGKEVLGDLPTEKEVHIDGILNKIFYEITIKNFMELYQLTCQAVDPTIVFMLHSELTELLADSSLICSKPYIFHMVQYLYSSILNYHKISPILWVKALGGLFLTMFILSVIIFFLVLAILAFVLYFEEKVNYAGWKYKISTTSRRPHSFSFVFLVVAISIICSKLLAHTLGLLGFQTNILYTILYTYIIGPIILFGLTKIRYFGYVIQPVKKINIY
jgi:hypothetical protein